MFLDIKPLKGFEWDCFMGHIASVASWYGCKYELAFAETWTFSPHKSTNTIEESYELLQKSGRTNINKLQKYINIRLEFHQNTRVSEVIKIIEDQLTRKHPVLIKFDLYWCPWFLRNYKISHNYEGHVFLIIGIDYDKNIFRCTDVSLMKYDCSLSFEEFKLGYDGAYGIFNEVQSCYPEEEEYFTSIKSTAGEILGITNGINKFDSMRIFADRLDELYTLARKENWDFFEGTKLFVDIIFTIQGRMHFANLLKIIIEQFNNDCFLDFYNEISTIIKKWSVIRILLSQVPFKNNKIYSLNKISKKIYHVSELEEKIAYGLLSKIK
jgi:hypothetical protein